MTELTSAILGYDVSLGIGKAVGPILGAERELQGTDDQVIADYVTAVDKVAVAEHVTDNFFKDALLRHSFGNPSPIMTEVGIEMLAEARPRLIRMFGNRRHAVLSLSQLRAQRESAGHYDSKPYLVAFMTYSVMADNFFKKGLWRDAVQDMEVEKPSFQRTAVDQTETYLDEKKRSRNAEHAALLVQDSTGVQLVERVVDELREELDQKENYPFCKEFVIAGAELGRDVYKIVYRVTE